MLRRQTIPVALATIVSLGSAAGRACAGDELSDAEEMAAIVEAKLSLSQAITTAEQVTGGKGLGAELEHVGGAIVFAVDVVKDNAVQTVLIDTRTGKIVVAVAEQDDDDTGEDEDDGDQEGQ